MYRASALHDVFSLFDEIASGLPVTDNDISYRLHDAGHRLRISTFSAGDPSMARGCGGLRHTTVQSSGLQDCIDLVAKHPHRIGGDAVSPVLMMLHPVIMLATLASVAFAVAASCIGSAASPWWIAAVVLSGILTRMERVVAGLLAYRRFGDAAALAFPVVHALRDVAWVAAIVTWCCRRVTRRPSRPSDSMTPRASGLPRMVYFRSPIHDERKVPKEGRSN